MSTTEESTTQDVFDVPAFINSRHVGAVQYGIIILCGLVMFLDGFDTRAISYMAPLIAKEWGLLREVLGPIFSFTPQWVFSSPHDGRLIGNYRAAVKRVRRCAGIHFIPHDLRRLAATAMERTGVPVYTLKAVLNHATGPDVTAQYVQVASDMKLAAMQKIEQFVLGQGGVRCPPSEGPPIDRSVLGTRLSARRDRGRARGAADRLHLADPPARRGARSLAADLDAPGSGQCLHWAYTVEGVAQGLGQVADLNGSLGWNRTNDQRINSPTLYR